METKNINQYIQELEKRVRLLESALKTEKAIYKIQLEKVEQLKTKNKK